MAEDGEVVFEEEGEIVEDDPTNGTESLDKKDSQKTSNLPLQDVSAALIVQDAPTNGVGYQTLPFSLSSNSFEKHEPSKEFIKSSIGSAFENRGAVSEGKKQIKDEDSIASLSDVDFEEKEDNNPLPRPKGLHPSTPLRAVIIIGPPGVYSEECTMICAEFAFSHVSISNALAEEDDTDLRGLGGITPALACKSIGAQITRCMEGIKGQTEYRSKRLVIISGFPPDERALCLFETKFPWIEVKAIVFFNAEPAIFAERVRGSKDFSPKLDVVESVISDYNSLAPGLLQLAKEQGKLYAIEDNGQAGDVFTRVRGCILAVVIDHLTVIAKNTTSSIANSKAKNLEDFKKYQHEPVSSRKEDTERFLESLQRDRELRMVQAQQKKFAEAEEARLQKEKKEKELEEERNQKKAKEAQLALARRQEEVERAARLKLQQRTEFGQTNQSLFPLQTPLLPSNPLPRTSYSTQYATSRDYSQTSRELSQKRPGGDDWRGDPAKFPRDSNRALLSRP